MLENHSRYIQISLDEITFSILHWYLLFGGEEYDVSRPSPKKCYVPSVPIKFHIYSVLLCSFWPLAKGLDLAMTFSRVEAGALITIIN